MRLDKVVRDYPAFLNALIAALESRQTRVYLDTSVLMWLVQVGAGPRDDFLAWCEGRPPGSVLVPVWAAHELHKHLVEGTVADNLRKNLTRAQSAHEAFVALAAERAEEDRCLAGGFTGRDAYVDAVRESAAQLRRLLDVVKDNPNDPAGLSAAADRVVDFVNAHLLSSDVGAVLRDLAVTGRVRSEHRMPPGFRDAHKAGAQAGAPGEERDDRRDAPKGNQHGDVIIWEEILADVRIAAAGAGGEPQDVVLVSRDMKTDWVTAAKFVRRGDGSAVKGSSTIGLDVRLAHPMLVHELVTRAGGRELFVVHPKALAPVLDYAARRAPAGPSGGGAAIGRWLAVSDLPTPFPPRDAMTGPRPPRSAGRSAPLRQPERPAAAPAGAPPVEDAVSLAGEVPSAADAPDPTPGGQTIPLPSRASDVLAEPVGPDRAAYAKADPREQEALLLQWAVEVRNGQRSLHQFGALLAELARTGQRGFPARAMAAIQSLDDAADARLPERAMLALLTATYFGRDGEPRPRPLVGLGSVLLPYEDDPRYGRAFDAVGTYLRTAPLVSAVYVPGSRTAVHCALEFGPSAEGGRGRLSGVTISGQAALVVDPDGDEARTLTALLGRQPSAGCSGSELGALLAREFLVPLARLDVQNARDELTWLDDARLVTLDLRSPGGLSAVAT